MAGSAWTLYPGGGRVPDAAAPDVRARSYVITAHVRLHSATDEGVLLAHGDRHAGYALRVAAGRLVHDYVHAGVRTSTRAAEPLPVDRPVDASVAVRREGAAAAVRLLVDGVEVGSGRIPALARARTGYVGLDVGCDRGLTVGDYTGPARFTGDLRRIEIVAEDDQWLDPVAIVALEASTG
jgi:arylsulfatase